MAGRGVLLLTCAVLALSAAPASAAVRCDSSPGLTVYELGGVRIFMAYATRNSEVGLYACTRRIRRPVELWVTSPATTLSPGVTRRFGRRIALDIEEYADGGNGRWVGWFDTRTGEKRLAGVGGPAKREDPEEDDSWTAPTRGLAVAPDGSLGYALAAFGKTYELFAQPYRDGRFRRRKAIATVAEAEFDPATLEVDAKALRWRTRGAPASAELPPAPATKRPRRARRPAGLRCTAGVRLHLGNRARVFRTARGLFVCSTAERARPVALGGRRARLLALDETGASLAYVLREGRREIVGVFDVRNGSLRTRARRAGDYGGRPRILDLATRTNGGVAYVAEEGSGHAVFHLASAGRGLGAPVLLGRGRFAPHTIRLERTRVRWAAEGEPRSAPR